MTRSRPRPAERADAPRALSLPGRAADDLRTIRASMERASLFTAVPGRGGMALGVVGLCGAAVASRQADAGAWLTAWLATAAVGLVTGFTLFWASARAEGQPLLGPTGRRFLLALAPSLGVGAVLTAVLPARGLVTALP